MGRRWGHDDKRRLDKNDMAQQCVQSSWEEEVGLVGHCPRVAVGDGMMRRCTTDSSSLHEPRGMSAAAASYLPPLCCVPTPIPYPPHRRPWSSPPYTHCHDRGGKGRGMAYRKRNYETNHLWQEDDLSYRPDSRDEPCLSRPHHHHYWPLLSYTLVPGESTTNYYGGEF
jgi:hypothetical protein